MALASQHHTGDNLLYGDTLQGGFVRLIRLLPAEAELGQIRCSLFEVSFSEAPKYEALSYMWGEPGIEQTILINNIEIQVRQNLWDAFSHLRGPRERILWADAICINQTNVKERNHQVKQMKRIYELSSKVVIWLGFSTNDSALGLEFITTAGRDPRDCFRGIDVGKQLRAVQKILQNPYWQRLWIIQEVVVASKVIIQCGRANITWESLSSFKKAVIKQVIEGTKLKFSDRLALSPLLDTVAFKLDLMRVAPTTNNLEELLRTFSGAQCSDTLDKIYGLVGLASDAGGLVIDYSKTPLDLFVDVMLLQNGNSNENHRKRLINFAQFLQNFLAVNVESPMVESVHSSRNSVAIQGYIAGAVKDFCPLQLRLKAAMSAPDAASSPWQPSSYDSEQLEQILQREYYNPFSKVIPICSNSWCNSKSYREHNPATRRYDEIVQIIENLEDLWIPHRRRQEFAEIELAEHPIFVDKGGHLGVAPDGTRDSDIICRFDGTNMVAILRWIRSDHDGERYVIVGCARYLGFKAAKIERRRPIKGLRNFWSWEEPPRIAAEGLRNFSSWEGEPPIVFHLDIKTLQLLAK